MPGSLETVRDGLSAPRGEGDHAGADDAREWPAGRGARGQRGARDPVREMRITTGVVATATSMLLVYAVLTPDGPNRTALRVALFVALSIHVSMLLFAGPRVARASRHGAGGLAFLVLCFVFVSAWVALDGGSTSPINTIYVIPLTVAVLRAPSASRLLAGLAIASSLVASLLADRFFSGAFDPAISIVWITQFVLTTVVAAWIANARNAQRHKLRQLTLELEDLAIRDPLTRVLNRRGFDAALSSVVSDPEAGTPTALLVADLDHFKRINDAHGHGAGDEVLVATARAICDAVRTGDIVARTGGEEFAIALLDADTSEAQVVAERVRRAVAACSVDLPVTASIGVAVADGSPPLERLHLAADRAMYQAKELGRDRVNVGSPVGPHDPSDTTPVTPATCPSAPARQSSGR